jgi:hypothetical protein
MSDYVYEAKFKRNGCPKCNGNHNGANNYFECEDCGFSFP